MGDKGDKSAARPPEGSLVETRCLIKGPKSAIVPFAEPRSGPKTRTGPGASQKAKSRVRTHWLVNLLWRSRWRVFMEEGESIMLGVQQNSNTYAPQSPTRLDAKIDTWNQMLPIRAKEDFSIKQNVQCTAPSFSQPSRTAQNTKWQVVVVYPK